MKRIMMSLRLVMVVVVAMALLVLAGCSKIVDTSTKVPIEDINTVRIVDFVFEPAALTVKAGTPVVWINEDSAPHKIKSDTFNSQNMKKADSFSQTFTQTGVYNYICDIHPSMEGKIIVE